MCECTIKLYNEQWYFGKITAIRYRVGKMIPYIDILIAIIIWIWRKKVLEGVIDLKTDKYDLIAVSVINRVQYVQM